MSEQSVIIRQWGLSLVNNVLKVRLKFILQLQVIDAKTDGDTVLLQRLHHNKKVQEEFKKLTEI